VHALVIASRFGLLLGLAAWLGLAGALLLAYPLLDRQLPPPQARLLAAALGRRFDGALFVALLLVVLSLIARSSVDRAVPAGSLVAPVALMAVCRLLQALALAPALRSLLTGSADAAVQRRALARLLGARGLLLTLEVCLGLYALLALS
jgi:hypothetical protein